jgi:hypothetical protein
MTNKISKLLAGVLLIATTMSGVAAVQPDVKLPEYTKEVPKEFVFEYHPEYELVLKPYPCLGESGEWYAEVHHLLSDARAYGCWTLAEGAEGVFVFVQVVVDGKKEWIEYQIKADKFSPRY